MKNADSPLPHYFVVDITHIPWYSNQSVTRKAVIGMKQPVLQSAVKHTLQTARSSKNGVVLAVLHRQLGHDFLVQGGSLPFFANKIVLDAYRMKYHKQLAA